MFIKHFLVSIIVLFSSSGLALDLDEAAHLLRRAEFGPTTARLDALVNKKTKLEAAQSLFSTSSTSSSSDFQKFINLTLKYEQDVQALLGQLKREQSPISAKSFKTQHKQLAQNYFNSVYNDIPLEVSGSALTTVKNKISTAISEYKIQTAFNEFSQSLITLNTLQNWWIKEALESQEPVREMMTLFWYGYFLTTFIGSQDIPLMALQHHTLRNNALGSFKTMMNEMNEGIALLYPMELSSNRGTGEIDDDDRENFRKFSKIMRDKLVNLSIGGHKIGKKNKQHARKALTGYRALFKNSETRIITFNSDLYSSGEKTFFNKTGELTKQDIIDALMEDDRTAKNVVQQLWLFFISSKPDKSIVKKWAKNFQADNYNIKNLLTTIFKSSTFYDHSSIQYGISKSPAEYTFSVAKSFNISAQNLIDIKSNIEPISLGYDIDKKKTAQVPLSPSDVIGGGYLSGHFSADSEKNIAALNAMLAKSSSISSWSQWARTYNSAQMESVLGTIFFPINLKKPVMTYQRDGENNSHYEDWLKKALTDFMYISK